MKVLLLADEEDKALWDFYKPGVLKDYDLIISCGDLHRSYLEFIVTMASCPLLYVRGNHDESLRKEPPEGCICIEDTIYIHNGVRILGLGGSMRYNNGVNQYTEREMRKRVRRLRFKLWRSKGIDILLTHAPAYQLGDDKDLAHRGFETFLSFIDKYHPRVLAHGHVHQSYQHDFKRVRQHGDTQVINACGAYLLEL